MTITLNTRPSKSGLIDLLQKQRTAAITIGLLAVGSVVLAVQSMYFASTMMVFIGCYLYPTKLWMFQNQFKSQLRRANISPALAMGAFLGFLAGITLLAWHSEPAQAQFFNNAQTFFTKAFGQGNNSAGLTSMIALIINVIRALFILYLLFGLVQVINAQRQGEEWKDLAKTPFLVMMAGTIGDLLIGQIGGP